MRALGQTPDDAPALAILAVSALVGGGFFAYQATRAVQAGGLFTVDEPEKRPMTAWEGATTGAALLTGCYLTYEGLKEAARDVGMEPLVLGGLGLTALSGVVWWRNR
jgi:hypothetical protein